MSAARSYHSKHDASLGATNDNIVPTSATVIKMSTARRHGLDSHNDAAGRLVHVDEHTDGKETDYLHGMGQTLARIKDSGNGDVFTYLHPDHLGSPQVGTSEAGGISFTEHYTPFGEALIGNAANDNQSGFTGHIKDKSTGLNYMQARYYDPNIGRFLSIDPQTMMSQNYDPRFFNRYAYTFNDPVNLTDPHGECPWCVVGAIVSAGIDIAIQKNTGDGTINWYQVGVSAGAGFVGVGVASKVATLSKGAAAVASKGAANPKAVTALVNTTNQAIAGGTVNVAAGAASRAVDGDVNTAPIDGMAALTDFAAGTVGTGVGHVVGEGLGAAATAVNLPKLGLGAKEQLTNLGRTVGKIGSDAAAVGSTNTAQKEMTPPCRQDDC